MSAKIVPLQGDEQAIADPRSYMKIAESVRRMINTGDLKPGDPVPIGDLSNEHGMARQTVSKGLALLCEEGRLKRWPGHGYIVQRIGIDNGD